MAGLLIFKILGIKIIMTTTTYHIVHNDQFIDQDTSMDALLVRLRALAEANPNNRYNIAIEGVGNPVPQPTNTTPT
jgi:hypothetical protein